MILGTFEETTRGKIPPRASVTTLARRRAIIKICGISIFSFFSPESVGEEGGGRGGGRMKFFLANIGRNILYDIVRYRVYLSRFWLLLNNLTEG